MAGSNSEDIPFRVFQWDTGVSRKGDIKLRLRYFTRAMQDVDEASVTPWFCLTPERAEELRDALDEALRRRDF